MLLIYSILLVVALAVILVIIVFTVKYKSFQDKNNHLANRLQESISNYNQLSDKFDQQSDTNLKQAKEIASIDAMKMQFQQELERLHGKILSLEQDNQTANNRILELEKIRSELEAHIKNANTNESKAQQALDDAQKRNEFWVDQMQELRVKYEALQLKLR